MQQVMDEFEYCYIAQSKVSSLGLVLSLTVEGNSSVGSAEVRLIDLWRVFPLLIIALCQFQGLPVRIFLVGKWFEDVTRANAENPRSPPMGYAEQKELLKVSNYLMASSILL